MSSFEKVQLDLSLQEAYERIREWFARPGAELSRDAAGGCYYRHPDKPGVRCAVGVLIPDEAYHPDMDGVGSVGAHRLVRASYALTLFLQGAQSQHDWSNSVPEFLRKLDHLARRHDLEVVA